MFARLTTIWVPPSRLEEAVQFVRTEVIPVMVPQPGLVGTWLLVARPAGKLLAIGLWESEEAMSATTFLYQELRAKVGSLYGGPPIAERYEARPPEQGVYLVHTAPARPGDLVAARVARVTMLEGAPERVEDVVRQVEAQIAPALERLRGYLGLYLLADSRRGTVRSVALWASAEALQASDAAVAPLRAEAAATLGARAAPSVELFEVAVQERGQRQGAGR